MFRRPTGWLPIALPTALMAFIVTYLLTVGAGDNRDEGTAAHVFQLAVALELVLLVIFAVRWLPRSPRTAGIVLGVQLMVAAIPILTVFMLGL